MADPEPVLVRIQEMLEHNLSLPWEEVSALATEYKNFCNEAERRLDSVLKQLQNGQRAQAIQAAEEPPPLLEAIAGLEFAAAGQWRTYTRANNLPSPRRFDPAKLQALQEAYGKHDALEPLMGSYRALCLKDACARERIVVLRRLLALDPGNRVWRGDVVSQEALRYREIASELEASKDTLDEQAAGALLAELTDPAAQAKPVATLVEAARAIHLDRKALRVCAYMRVLVNQINEAYAASDFPALSAALQSLDETANNEGVPVPEEHQVALEEARAWHAQRREEQDRLAAFNADVEKLRQALDQQAAGPVVQGLMRKLRGYDMDVPDALLVRGQGYVRKLELQQLQRRRVIQVVVTIGTLLFSAAVGFAVWNWRTQERAGRLAKELLACAADADFEGAAKLLKEIEASDPGLLDHDCVEEARRGLRAAEEKEQERAQTFRRLVQQAQVMAPTDPALKGKLDEAWGVARTRAEKSELDQLEARRKRGFEDQEEANRKQAEAVLAQVKELLVQLREAREVADIEKLCEQAEEKLRTLSPGLPPELKDVANGYGERVKKERQRSRDLTERARQDADTRRRGQEALQSLRQVLPDIVQYAQRLRARRDDFPGLAETQGLSRWEGQTGTYHAIVEWGRALRAKLKPGQTFVAYAGFQVALKGYSIPSPGPLRNAMEAERRRVEYQTELDKNLTPLRRLLELDRFSKWYAFEARPVDGGAATIYFTDLSARKQGTEGGIVRVPCRLDPENSQCKPKAFDESKVKVSDPQLAPHAVLTQKLSERLKNEGVDGNSVMPELIQEILAFAEANPWPRSRLLMKVVECDAANLNVLALPEDLGQAVKNLSVPETPFYAAEDKNVQAELAKIQKKLDDLQPALKQHLSGPVAAAQQVRALAYEALARPLALAGVVIREAPAEQPQLFWVEPESSCNELWSVEVPEAIPAKAGPAFVVVATRHRDGNWLWLTPEAGRVVTGQPLLAPVDGQNTAELWRRAGKAKPDAMPPAPWPANVKELAKHLVQAGPGGRE